MTRGWWQATRASIGRWRVLHELRTVERQNSGGFGKDFEIRIDLAREAHDRGDRQRSLTIWREARGLFPERAMTSPAAMRLLLDLGAFDEADAMMREGQRRHPRDPRFAADYARTAYRRGDLPEALRRCEMARKTFPRAAEGYTIAAACLVSLDRRDEAAAILGRAARKLPRNFEVLVEYARLAERQKDWPEALRRWGAVKNRFDHISWRGGFALCLREMGRYAEAEKIALETQECFPTDPWAFAELAHIAAAQGDLDEANRRWETARRHCPFFPLAYAAGAEAMRRAGREAEADAILGLGVTRLRGDLGLHLDHARAAHRRGDWAAAVDRWALARERFPDCGEAREQGAHAATALERQNRMPNLRTGT